MRPILLTLLLSSAMAYAADQKPEYPLWNGEPIEEYAKKVDLLPTKTLDLGNGISLELVLIPAGEFVMGTPQPEPVDEAGFRSKILFGLIVFAIGVGMLSVLIGIVLARAIYRRHRPRYSLAMLLGMMVVSGMGLLGGLHWHFSSRALSEAEHEYAEALVKFENSSDNEKPSHEVTIMEPYYIGRHEVTQSQYQQVMGNNPSHFKGHDLPVEMVTWDDAVEFCRKASKDLTTIRIPTEAEWEYACRAGVKRKYFPNSVDRDNDLEQNAWYRNNSMNTTHPVGLMPSNVWGVHDMLGNVSEWCSDWYENYRPGKVADPKGPNEGNSRVLRGGSWLGFPGSCSPVYRHMNHSSHRSNRIGFRIVVNVTTRPRVQQNLQ